VGFLGRSRPTDRRESSRIDPGTALRAFYWTGGACPPRRVRDISEGGAYIETGADWCVGTVIHLVLERDAQGETLAKAALELWARIVYIDSRGMGIEFGKMDRRERRQFQQFLEASIGVFRFRDEYFKSVRRQQSW